MQREKEKECEGGVEETEGQQRNGNRTAIGPLRWREGINDRMDRRGRGFNELMTVLTTRCLLSPAQTQPMK